ncbi:hypothetical protein ACHAW5_007251, partial [Stephanodiscus triporus]
RIPYSHVVDALARSTYSEHVSTADALLAATTQSTCAWAMTSQRDGGCRNKTTGSKLGNMIITRGCYQPQKHKHSI